MYDPQLQMTDTETVSPNALLLMPDGTYASRSNINAEFWEMVAYDVPVTYNLNQIPDREWPGKDADYDPFHERLVTGANLWERTHEALSANDPYVP